MSSFILNRQKAIVEITDFEAAKKQCKEAIYFLRTKNGIKFPEALKDWEHILFEIEKIENKN